MNKKIILQILSVSILCLVFTSCSNNDVLVSSTCGTPGCEIDHSAPTDPNASKFAKMIPPKIFPAKEHLVYDYLGLEFDLPEILREECRDNNIIIDGDFKVNDEEKRLEFANIKFIFMDDIYTGDMDFIGQDEEWKAQAFNPFTLGVYHKDYLAQNPIETITLIKNNEQVATEEDYLYYISKNEETTETTKDLYDKVKDDFDVLAQSIKTALPTELISTSKYIVYARSKTGESNMGEFNVKDIFGEEFTQDVFSQNDLTLVNVFTTWCTPCVKEIPDLHAINEELENVGVIGFVLDIIDPVTGGVSQAKIDIAQQIAEKTGAKYPMLIPDQSLMDGRLRGITTFPESFFVDREGNIVGETIIGSKSKQGWIEIINQTLRR